MRKNNGIISKSHGLGGTEMSPTRPCDGRQECLPHGEGRQECRPHWARARGFTITEMLVVIGIIILVLAMAVPAYRFITGSRSQSSAENIIAAAMARARVQAINDKSYVGVFFYYDPGNERTTLALVKREGGGLEDPDPYDNYKSWQTGVVYHAEPYRDRVIFFSVDNEERMTTPTPADNAPRVLVRRYRCTETHTSAAGNAPPVQYNLTTNSPPPYNRYWENIMDGDLDLLSGVDLIQLPVGLGAQLVSQAKTSAGGVDRYVQTGCILFDPQGRMDVLPYYVSPNSALGKTIGLTNQPMDVEASQVGVVLHELERFRNAGGDEGDPTLRSNGLPVENSNGTEPNEELWLDDNTTMLMVNRTTGNLVKAE